MKLKYFFAFAFCLLFASAAAAQVNNPQVLTVDPASPVTIEKISKDLSNISKSLQTFNERLNAFLDSLNKYKGIQLSEPQQRLLFNYEVLNQTEQRAATLRKSLVEMSQSEATLKRRIGEIDIELQQENIERSVQFKGTTRAEENRELRRKVLSDERAVLQNVVFEVEQSRQRVAQELREIEIFAQNFRRVMFSQLQTLTSNF